MGDLGLDLNTLPVWLIAIAILLYLLPRIIGELSKFIPSLGSFMQQQNKTEMEMLQLLGKMVLWMREDFTGLTGEMEELRKVVQSNNRKLTEYNKTLMKVLDKLNGGPILYGKGEKEEEG